MTCSTCYWTHTDPHAAIACYRAANPVPGAPATTPQGSRSERPRACTRPVESGGISITAQRDGAYRATHPRGRPKQHASSLIARREAQRAYRLRRAEVAAP